MKNNLLKWINTIAFILMVVINALANILPIGIGNTGAVSEKYPNLFTPAPITFSIWGIIYLLMALFILYQWGLIGPKERSNKDVETIGIWFVASCIFNILWIFTWHFDIIWLSLIMMLGLIASLIIISTRISSTTRRGFSYLSVNVGFDIYLGWIIAATIANVSVFLVSINFDGFGISPVIWTSIVVMAGALIGTLPTLISKKWFATGAVIWAYAGILVNQISQNGLGGKYPAIIVFTIIGIVILAISIAIKLVIEKSYDELMHVV